MPEDDDGDEGAGEDDVGGEPPPPFGEDFDPGPAIPSPPKFPEDVGDFRMPGRTTDMPPNDVEIEIQLDMIDEYWKKFDRWNKEHGENWREEQAEYESWRKPK